MKPPPSSAKFDSAIALVQKHLSVGISGLPPGFYDTFEYTRTGNNYCHAITLSLIGEAIRSVAGVEYVGFDVRFNRGKGIKFQPDVVGFGRDLKPIIYADFESPNSSDARLIEKDIEAFQQFTAVDRNSKKPVPYLIVTSLPNFTSEDWECHWTSPGYWNHGHAEKLEVLLANPFEYWTTHWQSRLMPTQLERIAFLNISGKTVERFHLTGSSALK
jgi:hypothetical protein